ncbi:MAG: endonuclease domain-containing protein [Calditrichia bacterium]
MHKSKIHNRKALKSRRKQLRNNSTSAEATLWRYLKGKQLQGRKFRRQHSIGNYIVDFYCPSEKLVIELDGAEHFTEHGAEYDEKRTRFLNNLGIRVIRFENEQVFDDIEGVLAEISQNFVQPPHPSGTPPCEGGE